jgi:hypothetical protein
VTKQKNLPAGVERIVAYVPVKLKLELEQRAAAQWQSASRVVYEALVAYLANTPRRGRKVGRGKR